MNSKDALNVKFCSWDIILNIEIDDTFISDFLKVGMHKSFHYPLKHKGRDLQILQILCYGLFPCHFA
jgi:hypothetical protein